MPLFNSLLGNTSVPESEKIKQLEEQVTQLENANSQLAQENAELETTNNQLTQENAELEKSNNQLTTENETLQNEVTELHAKVSDYITVQADYNNGVYSVPEKWRNISYSLMDVFVTNMDLQYEIDGVSGNSVQEMLQTDEVLPSEIMKAFPCAAALVGTQEDANLLPTQYHYGNENEYVVGCIEPRFYWGSEDNIMGGVYTASANENIREHLVFSKKGNKVSKKLKLSDWKTSVESNNMVDIHGSVYRLSDNMLIASAIAWDNQISMPSSENINYAILQRESVIPNDTMLSSKTTVYIPEQTLFRGNVQEDFTINFQYADGIPCSIDSQFVSVGSDNMPTGSQASVSKNIVIKPKFAQSDVWIKIYTGGI